MDEFDFHKVQKIFEQNEWTYGVDQDRPTVGELRRTARNLLAIAYDKPRDGCHFTGTGRFTASLIEDTKEKWIRLELMFTPEEYGIDEGVEYE